LHAAHPRAHQVIFHVAAAALAVQGPGDEPVWRQLLRWQLTHSSRAVTQQVLALLGE
jgi:predicted NAD/FAD-dependent oxidoreductase